MPNTQPAAAYFASGSNRASEIRALRDVGHHIGVAAPELSEAAVVELEACRCSGVRVFVDSGAFSEVDFPEDGPPVVVRPIDDAEWQTRLALYRRLALALGEQLHVVAPDRVGSQPETLARLTRYADQVRELADLGATVLVPLQRGDLTMAAFGDAVAEVLDGRWWMPAMPMRKAATSPEAVLDFVTTADPAGVHLLGIGTRDAAPLVAALADVAPEVAVQLDSGLIRAHAQRTRYLGRLTANLDIAREELDAARWGTPPAGEFTDDLGDWTDLASEPSAWLGRDGAKRIADLTGMTRTQRRAWYADPDAFLQAPWSDDDDRNAWEVLDAYGALETEWQRRWERTSGTARKYRATVRTFADRRQVHGPAPALADPDPRLVADVRDGYGHPGARQGRLL